MHIFEREFMSMKNLLIILLLSLYAMSCDPPRSGVYLVDIQSYDTTYMYNVYAVQNEYTGNANLQSIPVTSKLIRNVDTLEIHFVFNTTREKIAAAPAFSLINTAYAYSPNPDVLTLKHKIDSVHITSDTVYNGMEKGQPLNAFFFLVQRNLRGGMQELIDQLNGEGALYSSFNFDFTIATDKKSGISTDQELFIKVYKSNGEVIEGSTGKFKWY